MKRNSSKQFALVFLTAFLLFCLWGCTPTIKTKTLMPAKANEAASLKRMAVLPFEGNDKVQADIESILVSAKAEDNKPFFDVVERNAIDKILKEQSLGASGAIDASSAAKIGKIAGVQGIVMGVVRTNTNDSSYSKTRSRCVAKDSEGNCTRRRRYQVSCTEREAMYSLTPKIVNVNTGMIVASETFSDTEKSSACSDSGYSLQSRNELLAKAKSKVLSQFKPYIAPHYVDVELTLITKDNSEMPDHIEERIKQGTTWAESGRMDRAQKIWEECYNQHQKGYALPYLVGLCHELAGDFNQASKLYKTADQRTTSPNGTISAALVRVTERMEQAELLQKQMGK